MSDVVLVPLTKESLEEAITVANRVFPHDVNATPSPRTSFTVSLDLTAHQDYLDERGIRNLRYWTTSRDDLISGFTGLYQLKEDSETVVWLGWFGLAPEARGLGLGRQLLNATIEMARAEGNKTLRLYTTSLPEEATAHKLYESVGLRIISEKEGEEYTTFVLEMAL